MHSTTRRGHGASLARVSRSPDRWCRAGILLTRVLGAALVVLGSARSDAQDFARYSVESVIAADEFFGENAVMRPQIIVDVSMAVRIGANWQAYVRPWFRQPRPTAAGQPVPDWDKELYQAGIRYERPGRVATRIDAGYILSPIGLGLYDVRPGLNPTIVPHLSYLQPMPVFDPTAPRASVIAASYPLGAQLTASTTRWDARAAVIGSAPTRVYAAGSPTNPRQTPVIVAGGGVTPITGLRLGAAVAHGKYATAEELTTREAGGRQMTMVTGEGEWAFGGTKFSGEVVRTSFETPGASASTAYEFFVQGQQTLTARWFAASRLEGVSAPGLVNGIVAGPRGDLRIFEATAGYRLSPDLSLRGSYYTRRAYGASTWTDQVGASLVWARRWW
jgi:hypothetical protein